MKVSIIGGSGFVGSNLAKLFTKNNTNFQILDNVKSKFFPEKYIHGDIRNNDDLKQIADSDILINLAAVHRDDVRPLSLYDDINVEGSRNICKLAKENGINKIIFTSSVAVYGFAKPNTNENGEINYFNDYGRTKYLAEEVFVDWYNEDPVNRTLVIIRPTVIFGKGNRGNVYNLLNQIHSKKFAMFGNGKNIKSMAYVKNVAAFINHSLSFDQGLHLYNYIDKPDMNMNKLVSITRKVLFNKHNVGLRMPAFVGKLIGYIADIISFLMKKNLPISSIRVKKFLSTTQFDSSIKITGFKAPYKLEDGLQKTLKYEFIEDNEHKVTFETE
jgi:nucleoside-diphosphate-sugar epimerase